MRKEERAFTYADYLSWPAEERWELIDGAFEYSSRDRTRVEAPPQGNGYIITHTLL